MPEHIEHTLARFARTVSVALTASGWQTRQSSRSPPPR